MKEEILEKVDKLYKMWERGELGGDKMPEDANPNLSKNSKENYIYFTLPMAINYRRNSYKLWESALKTYQDNTTRFVFDMEECLKRPKDEVKIALTKYGLALQPERHTDIWLRLCQTFSSSFNGDIRNIFTKFNNNIEQVRNYMQKTAKKSFPYLSGLKLCNYWFYVLYKYANQKYTDPENLTVAPDTHVCIATLKLGLIKENQFLSRNVQNYTINAWQELLKGTKYNSADVSNILWLWTRGGCKEIK